MKGIPTDEGLFSSFKWNSHGLIPVVIQDAENGDVLMFAWMNEMALRQTLQTGLVTFWSRSRKELWVKGETSGHFQTLKSIAIDCDEDCLLIRVIQEGVACHEMYRSCFFRSISADGTIRLNQERPGLSGVVARS
ncbi:MAG: phosphoribosyl-AMP cyclohydrolase [Patescibacteria group bacterium]